MFSFLRDTSGRFHRCDWNGLNLILWARIVFFVQTEKFDGKETRPLKTEEIRQIAGRVGRFGLYDTGYINAVERGRMLSMASASACRSRVIA